jgi:hypothetical protein
MMCGHRRGPGCEGGGGSGLSVAERKGKRVKVRGEKIGSRLNADSFEDSGAGGA